MQNWNVLRSFLLLLSLLGVGCRTYPLPPDFTLTLNPTPLTVAQGGTGTTTLTLTPLNGFTGQVTLSLVGAPAGVTLSPTSLSVTGPGPVNQALTLTVASTTPTGSYNLKVRATGGGITKEADLNLTVTPPPDFTLTLNPTALTVAQGGTGTTTLTLTPLNGFTGQVTLSLVGAPAGVTLSPTSLSVTGPGPVNQALTLTVASTTPTGSYNLKVRATGGGITKEADLNLTVIYMKSLVPILSGRSGNTYTVEVNLEGTTEAYRGVQFTVELPLAFNLSASVGSLTPGCILDYAQVSPNPNRWNIALVCTGAFNGPGELVRLFVTGTGGGTLTLTNAMLVRPDYTEETVPSGSLVLAP